MLVLSVFPPFFYLYDSYWSAKVLIYFESPRINRRNIKWRGKKRIPALSVNGDLHRMQDCFQHRDRRHKAIFSLCLRGCNSPLHYLNRISAFTLLIRDYLDSHASVLLWCAVMPFVPYIAVNRQAVLRTRQGDIKCMCAQVE